jgi:lambda family phage tail tape measure protein
MESMKIGIDDVASFWTNRFQSMEDALVDFVKTGKFDFKSLMESMTEEVIRFYLRAALFGNARTGSGGLFGGGDFGSVLNGITSIFSKKGNVFQNGGLQKFQKGGVMSQPFSFPMNNGKTGIGAEAGPEAIMPLRRDARGNLGVTMSGARGGNTTNIFIDGNKITMQGSTPREIGEAIAIYTKEQAIRQLERV